MTVPGIYSHPEISLLMALSPSKSTIGGSWLVSFAVGAATSVYVSATSVRSFVSCMDVVY